MFLLAVNITLGYSLTSQSAAAMRTLINSRMLDISNTAAAMLDGDALGVLQKDDRDSPAYRNALKTLTYFQENIDLSYIYCIRDMGSGVFVFSVDPSEDPGEFGEPVVSTEALHQASLGMPAVDREPYEDAWGRFYSAYSPVFDSQHRVSGIVAVDFSADWYDRQISSHVTTTLYISILSFVFAGIIILLVAGRFRNRFRSMLREMNNVSDGIETLVRETSPGAEKVADPAAGVPRSNDEIVELGNRIQLLGDRLSEQIAFVRSQAYLDGLTQLGNRTAYEERIRHLDDEVRDGSNVFSVVLFDLNGLKEINDSRGHGEGDRAISRVAEALQQVFFGEQIYRIGGDEFVVILDGVCGDIDARMDEVSRIVGDSDLMSVAIGYAAYDPETDAGFRDVFRRADNAMYENKKRYYIGRLDRRKKQ